MDDANLPPDDQASDVKPTDGKPADGQSTDEQTTDAQSADRNSTVKNSTGETSTEIAGDGRAEAQDVSSPEGSRFSTPRIRRLAMKELRETLRDRRTIVTLILMPLLVYPILSLVFRTFLFNTADSLRESGPARYSFVVDGEAPDGELFSVLTQLGLIVEGYVPDDLSPRSIDREDAERPAAPRSAAEFMEQSRRQNENADGEQGGTGSNGDPEVTDPRFDPSRRIGNFWEHNWAFPSRELPQTVETIVESGQADAGLKLILQGRERFQLAKYEIVYDPGDAGSFAAARYLREVITRANKVMLSNAMRASYDPIQEVGETRITLDADANGGSSRVSIASLIPLILVLMTITGAVYPAIDLTAGERERGTLETLMAAPVPRMGILFSKFVAVLTVAILTATLNILGMAATVWAFGLDAFFGHEAGLTGGMILRIFGLLVLFASFFSAILLAVTSYARSFKEAQSYLIPIILLSMAPGLMAMTPGLSLAGPLCVTPMVNLLLLARDVLQQQVLPAPSIIAVLSTLLYTGLGIFVAARIFGTDAILYGSQGSWSDLYLRPRQERRFAPVPAIAFSLALLFPLNFVMIAILGRFGEMVQVRFALMGLFTFISFVVIPWLIARHQKVNATSGFGLAMPRVVFVMGAVVLGISLWPIVMSMISLWHDLYASVAGAESTEQWRERLVELSSEQVDIIRTLPPLTILIAFSVIPAICEEWFFRGFLLRGLLNRMTKWRAIIISAVLFGFFHTLSGSVVAFDRLIPTIAIGIVLGYVCYKSNSIVPGVILHMIHNGIVVFLAYYEPQLRQFDWFPSDGEVPYWWMFVALVPAVIGIVIVARPVATPMLKEK